MASAYLFALSALAALAASASAQTSTVPAPASPALWNATTCVTPGSTVTDATCCSAPAGQPSATLPRDSVNNVCCPYAVSDICGSITQGNCPSYWIVDPQCCPTLASQKYTPVLTVPAGKVCCNTPCTEVNKITDANTKTTCMASAAYQGKCGIQSRSLGATNYGFSPSYLNPSSVSVGNVLAFQPKALPGSGYVAGAATYSPAGVYSPSVATPSAYSGASTTTEVTIDDLIASLTSALSNDNGVFNFNTQSSTNPYTGAVTKSGAMWGTNYQTPYNTPYGTPYSPYSTPYTSYNTPYSTPYSSYNTPYSTPYSSYSTPYSTPYSSYSTPYSTPYTSSYSTPYTSSYNTPYVRY